MILDNSNNFFYVNKIIVKNNIIIENIKADLPTFYNTNIKADLPTFYNTNERSNGKKIVTYLGKPRLK